MKETVQYQAPEGIENASVTVFDKSGVIKTYSLKGSMQIGRKTDGTNVELSLDSAIVSRRHGEFFVLDGSYFYRDLDSLNGTVINSVRYGRNEKNAACRLADGDVLRIDRTDLNKTHPEAVLLLFSLRQTNAEWKKLELREDTGSIQVGRDTVGKDRILLDDIEMSRNHAVFLHGINGWAIVDRGSTNGVYVNNSRIDSPAVLHRMDMVRIANANFLFLGDYILYNGQESTRQQLVINITERSVKNLFSKRVLLEDIHISVNPGEMVLILGGSGAGKTTFFNAVMGYEKAEGQIMHGDTDIYKEYSKMKYKIGFVPQQDLMREDDTVIATLDNAAHMKMEKGTTAAARAERINSVIDLLGLSRERNSMVRKLSGGQKKRLSIAIEFIADPSLFFLDEPDSGLDGIMATALMENLRVIADEGKIIMVITHAPDRVARLFDKVVVLAKSTGTNSGQLAFFGDIAEAKSFFDTDSMEGIVRRINRPDEGGDGLADHYIDQYRMMVNGGTADGNV